MLPNPVATAMIVAATNRLIAPLSVTIGTPKSQISAHLNAAVNYITQLTSLLGQRVRIEPLDFRADPPQLGEIYA